MKKTVFAAIFTFFVAQTALGQTVHPLFKDGNTGRPKRGSSFTPGEIKTFKYLYNMSKAKYIAFATDEANASMYNVGFVKNDDVFTGCISGYEVSIPVFTREEMSTIWKTIAFEYTTPWKDSIHTRGTDDFDDLVPFPRLPKPGETFWALDVADLEGMEELKKENWHFIILLASMYCGNTIEGAHIITEYPTPECAPAPPPSLVTKTRRTVTQTQTQEQAIEPAPAVYQEQQQTLYQQPPVYQQQQQQAYQQQPMYQDPYYGQQSGMGLSIPISINLSGGGSYAGDYYQSSYGGGMYTDYGGQCEQPHYSPKMQKCSSGGGGNYASQSQPIINVNQSVNQSVTNTSSSTSTSSVRTTRPTRNQSNPNNPPPPPPPTETPIGGHPSGGGLNHNTGSGTSPTTGLDGSQGGGGLNTDMGDGTGTRSYTPPATQNGGEENVGGYPGGLAGRPSGDAQAARGQRQNQNRGEQNAQQSHWQPPTSRQSGQTNQARPAGSREERYARLGTVTPETIGGERSVLERPGRGQPNERQQPNAYRSNSEQSRTTQQNRGGYSGYSGHYQPQVARQQRSQSQERGQSGYGARAQPQNGRSDQTYQARAERSQRPSGTNGSPGYASRQPYRQNTGQPMARGGDQQRSYQQRSAGGYTGGYQNRQPQYQNRPQGNPQRAQRAPQYGYQNRQPQMQPRTQMMRQPPPQMRQQRMQMRQPQMNRPQPQMRMQPRPQMRAPQGGGGNRPQRSGRRN